MKMIVTKSTFQDEKSGADIRGLGLVYCRTLWTGVGVFFETVLESYFTEGRQASVNNRSSLKNNRHSAFVPLLLIVNVLSGNAGETV